MLTQSVEPSCKEPLLWRSRWDQRRKLTKEIITRPSKALLLRLLLLLTLCLIQRLEATSTVLQLLTAERLKYLSKIKTTHLKKGSSVALAASVWPHAVVAHRDLNISDNATCAAARSSSMCFLYYLYSMYYLHVKHFISDNATCTAARWSSMRQHSAIDNNMYATCRRERSLTLCDNALWWSRSQQSYQINVWHSPLLWAHASRISLFSVQSFAP